MKIKIDPRVKDTFDNYPLSVKKQLLHFRELILMVASEIDMIDWVEETLKWGEPSYLTKHGSTIRMDWKKKKPEQYALYFKCTSKLVPTFREIHKDTFKYEDNRAIIFGLKEKIPERELKQCIGMALTYHKIKHLPLLGG